jgi:hypothetical protein
MFEFEFNPKLLLVIPASVIFYKLLSKKEEVNNNEASYPYFKNQKIFEKSLIDYKKMFEKPKSPKTKLFKIMDDSIQNKTVKKILANIIDDVVKKTEEKEVLKDVKNISYLSYFNISKMIYSNEGEFEKVDLSSEGSYDRISKMSDFSKISEFSKIEFNK